MTSNHDPDPRAHNRVAIEADVQPDLARQSTDEASPAPSKNDLPTLGDPGLLEAKMSGWCLRETAELFKGFPITAEDTVLDVGCGDGNYIKFCASFGAEVIFADIDEQKIAAVTNKLKGSPARSVRPLVTDVNPLPLSDETATKIVAMEVIEHVDDPKLFLQELVRVGKPGAQFLITVPDPIGETLQKQLAPPEYFEKPNHIRIIERDELDGLVRGAGLEIEHKTYYGFYWCLWWLMFWTADGDLSKPPPPLLKSWGETWHLLLTSEQGAHVKRVLDDFMPKSQVVIARKL